MLPTNSLPLIRAPILAIMLFQVAALFLRSLVEGQLVDAGFEREFANDLSYLLVVPAVEIVLFWPILRDNRQSLMSLFPVPASWCRMLAVAVALGIAARLAGWSIIFFAGAFGLTGYAPAGLGSDALVWFSCPPAQSLATAIVVAAILIPIGEEVINRGLIMGNLLRTKNKHSVALAIVLSAALFAVLHTPSGIPAAFVIGLLFAIQTIRCGSLLPAIVSHATYNFMRILDWSCLHIVWHPESSTPQLNLLGGATMITGLLSITAAIWLAGFARTGAANVPRS
jgi:membrane protease YdiL (CAAX protease family)